MKIQLNLSFLRKTAFTLAFSLVGFFVLTGSAIASCTLSTVTLPASAGDHVNGNPYQITFTTTEGVGGTCAADAAQFEAWYIYDSNDDASFADEIWQWLRLCHIYFSLCLLAVLRIHCRLLYVNYGTRSDRSSGKISFSL